MTKESDLLEKAAGVRRKALTKEQLQRRRLNDERSDLIQRGVKAKDGVTFAKKGRSAVSE